MAVPLAASCSGQPAHDPALPPSASSSITQSQTAQRQDSPALVLAFGDSLYAGYGLASSQSFPAALERKLAAQGITSEVVNAGISGDTTAGGRARLAGALDRLRRKPDLVLLGLGANDVLRGFSPSQTRANLETMIQELKARRIPVMLTSITMPAQLRHPYLISFETIYPELARKYDLPLESSFLDGVLANPRLLLGDRIHPNAAGVERMADRVAPRVADILSART